MSNLERAPGHVSFGFFSDLISLTKPKITLMALLVAIAGLLHAQEQPTLLNTSVLFSLLGIVFLVSGSSALNMYLERELDARMARTKERPLPAKRIHAYWAILVGLVSALFASFLLLHASNTLTVIAGILSLGLYVWGYTPLKKRSWVALLVGSIPGAMPVMLGYLSWAGHLDQKSISLFLWAFLWQIPHFLAISIFREKEYTAAGFPVMSASLGIKLTKNMLIVTSWLLVFSTVGLYMSAIIDLKLLVIALFFGVWFLWTCHRGFYTLDTNIWAKRAFKASLVYQSLVFVLLIYAGISACFV